MLKSIIIKSLFASLVSLTLISQTFASIPNSIPPADQNNDLDLVYYENKQTRCLDAFARSDFEVAYTICTPLANLGFKDAQLVTGLLYAYGEGVDKDLHRAKIWLIEALKNGREDAARALREFGME